MWKRRNFIRSVATLPILATAVGRPGWALAQSSIETTDAEISAADFEYVPPTVGAPEVRVSGGTRGLTGADFTIEAIAPQHLGLTHIATPTLYWYQSAAVAEPVELVVLEDSAEVPLMQATLEAGTAQGFNRVTLSDFGAALQPASDHQWSVAVLMDKEQPSLDPVSIAGIRLTTLDAALVAELDAATPLRRALLYARHGLFYESMHALSMLIAENPADHSFHELRAALLRSVELYGPAEYDLQS